jgi:hypothetical protein
LRVGKRRWPGKLPETNNKGNDTMRLIATLALLALAACGADGAPSAAQPGVTVSGEVAAGVVVVNPNQIEGQP